MTLFHLIQRAPLFRPQGLPGTPNIAVCCRPAAIEKIPAHLLRHAQGIFVILPSPGGPTSLTFSPPGETPREIPIVPLMELAKHVSLEIVYFHHIYEHGPLATAPWHIQVAGFDFFYLFMPIPYNVGITTTHIPNYYAENKKHLDFFYDILSDQESRLILASRIRALETGNIGYLRVSRFPEYFHPLVKPEAGDIIIDGGVSENINSQIQFSRAVGETGKIYGFEPDPLGYAEAAQHLQTSLASDNYKLIPLGLWHKSDKISFLLDGQGTHVSNQKDDSVITCNVISIDEFVASSRIRKVDFIKLDVEGAESNCLRGAIKTIGRFRPRLAISIYHTPGDLYRLPRLVHELGMGYKFSLGHHHGSLHETILYAHCGDDA